jgi:hypothetical protein
MLVVYLLTLFYAHRRSQLHDSVEAITFHLTEKFLELANCPSILRGPNMALFFELDAAVRAHFPRLFRPMQPPDMPISIEYALRWRLLFFADEHSILELMLLWDAIILKKSAIEIFFRDLAVEHLREVKFQEGVSVVYEIQHNRTWDTEKLIVRSTKLFEDREQRRFRLVVIPMLVLILLFLFGANVWFGH